MIYKVKFKTEFINVYVDEDKFKEPTIVAIKLARKKVRTPTSKYNQPHLIVDEIMREDKKVL